MAQCKGTTKKGERCKITVEGSTKYCRYHISQGSSGIKISIFSSDKKTTTRPTTAGSKKTITQSISKITTATKTTTTSINGKGGLIYLYTLEHLISSSPQKQEWLRMHKPNLAYAKPFNPKNQILIKVGCTTTSVPNRIKQWESQCGHKLQLINPYSTIEVLDPMSMFVSRFAKLNLVTLKQYKNFKFDQLGFVCEKNVLQIELVVHQVLREMYGTGTVFCQGCVDKLSKKNYNTHVEWFLIPRRDIDRVFKVIDKVIEKRK